MHTVNIDLLLRCIMSGISDLRKLFKVLYRTVNPLVNRL